MVAAGARDRSRTEVGSNKMLEVRRGVECNYGMKGEQTAGDGVRQEHVVALTGDKF